MSSEDAIIKVAEIFYNAHTKQCFDKRRCPSRRGTEEQLRACSMAQAKLAFEYFERTNEYQQLKELHTPKKPIEDGYYNEPCVCPNCGMRVDSAVFYSKHAYCYSCGQALDWEGVKENV